MPPARCLDITRLISRLGRGAATGVDRVELAYLRAFLDDPTPTWLLAKTALGFVLVGPEGAQQTHDALTGRRDWGRADLIGRLTRKAHPLKRRAEADLRRGSVARCRKGGLARMLARHLPQGTEYYNVGHSNLSEEALGAWSALPGATVHVLVHDTIPLDHPAFQRPGTVESFRGRMTRVSRFADRVIYTTRAAQAQAERWFAEMGRVPAATVAPLGVDLPAPDPSRRPGGLRPPYFLAVGTIEPRKNHALLLDAWERMGDAAPQLVIAGRRGWNNEAVFSRLDTLPMMGRTIIERDDLDDAALAVTLQGAAALLFPSLAEGFGLPPIEAAALQVPVICTDLPSTRELLGDIPIYLDPGDVYLWINTIRTLAAAEQAGQATPPPKVPVPTWSDHFNTVLKVR